MLLDEAFHDREPKTSPHPEIFRCEKGLEYLRTDLFRHPMACIGDAEAYMTILSIEAQPEAPPLRHGMEAIRHQIDQHLRAAVAAN